MDVNNKNNCNKIDIYYVTKYDEENFDIKSLEMYINTYFKINFNIGRFEKVESDIIDDDKIKEGFKIFNEMYNNLKLKSCNQVWFLYFTKGNYIEGDNVDIILLNKDVSIKECLYNINKNNLNLLKSYSKSEKLNKLNDIFRNNLDNIVKSNKFVKYNKIQ